MVSAYQKYKDKLNPQEKTQTGGRISAAQNAFNVMDAAGQKINSPDVQNLTHEEWDNFATALDNQKQIVESKIQAMAQ